MDQVNFPIKGASYFRINQLFTIYHGVHIPYLTGMTHRMNGT